MKPQTADTGGSSVGGLKRLSVQKEGSYRGKRRDKERERKREQRAHDREKNR
jgi:hypothetical protein